MTGSDACSHRDDVSLPEAPQADVIEMLERALARARCGELSGAALAMTGANGNVSTEWAGGDFNGGGLGSRITLGCAISWLNARFFSNFSEASSGS